MSQTKGYEIKGKQVILRENRYCIHSNKVKEKQGSCVIKHSQSFRTRNINCNVSIYLQLEKWHLKSLDYPLEVNIRYTHNYVIESAESLSF